MGGAHWLSLQMLLDSALPVGSFAHSYGLETLVQDGAITNAEDLRRYMQGMIRHNWAVSDLMVVKAVYRAEAEQAGDLPGKAGGVQEWAVGASETGVTPKAGAAGKKADGVPDQADELAKQMAAGIDGIDYAFEVETRVHLQRLGAETRDGIVKTGRRLLALARELFPDERLEWLASAVHAQRCWGTYPLVYAYVCRMLGVPLMQAAEGYLYACVTACAGAGLRLMAIGQSEAQRIVASLLPDISAAWSAVEEMDPMDAYSAMPMAELAMMRHERLYSRLFMS
jgi:urease accessory protein